jgi:hypothetical protein
LTNFTRVGGTALSACLSAAVLAVLLLPAPASSTHARPKGATPKYSSLAIAYQQCASAPPLAHRAPLSLGSCHAGDFTQVSPWLTVCDPIAWGCAADFVGLARMDACTTTTGPCTGTLPPDLKLTLGMAGVRCKPALTSPCGTQTPLGLYGGEVEAIWNVRITDHCNNTSPPTFCGSTSLAGTVSDFSISATTTCSSTILPPANNCALSTSANSLVPGAFVTASRSNIEAHVSVTDGGSDAVVSTPPNDTFATEGVFLP